MQSSPKRGTVLSAIAAEASQQLDARIESALRWADENRLADITLAIPYEVPADSLCALAERQGITSLIVVGSNAPGLKLDSVGSFQPVEYSWRLPQRVGARILYIGAGSRITAPMLKACLRRGVREIGYWDIDRWALRKTLLLAVDKVREKGSSHLSRAILALDRLRGKLLSHVGFSAEGSGGAALRMLWYAEGRYRRGFRRVVKGADAIERLQPVKGRVVFVCSTLVAGGAERQIVNTAVGLKRRGIDSVTVLAANLFSRPGNDFFLQPLLTAGIEVREIGSPVSSATEWEEYQMGAAELHQFERAHALLLGLPKDLVQDILNLYTILHEIRPEVVHSWLDYSNVRAGYAAILAGVPRIVVSGRNVSPIHFPYILEPHMRAAYQGLATRPEIRFVNNSAEGAKDYAAWIGVPASRFRIIRNGIDISQTTRADEKAVVQFRCAHGVPAAGLVVGGMFRFSPEKRPLLWLETAVELTARRPDVNCLLFGDGPLRPKMEQYLSECGAYHRIQLVKPTPNSTLALTAFDVLLLTSEWEGTPNVVIEAQAIGTPVVATGGGGTREALHDGVTGFYVEHPTVDQLAQAVEELLSRPRVEPAGPSPARQFVSERFGLERMISETLEAYGFRSPPHLG